MSDITPKGPLSHHQEMEIYRRDFARGSNLLKQATNEYLQTTEEHKKAELQKSMSEAIEAMNEILNNVLHERSDKYEKKITDDYQNFINNANNDTMNKLNKDIDRIEKGL